MKKERKKRDKKINMFLVIIIVLILLFIVISFVYSVGLKKQKGEEGKGNVFSESLNSLKNFLFLQVEPLTESTPFPLNSSYAPEIANLGGIFQIKCNFGVPWLGCVQAYHGTNACNISEYIGEDLIWNCTAKNIGMIDNYCNLFDLAGTPGCVSQTNKINATNVTIFSLYDYFDAAKINISKWVQHSINNPANIENGKLKCNASAEPQALSISGVSSERKWTLQGNFDIQVDFNATNQLANDSAASTSIAVIGTGNNQPQSYILGTTRLAGGNYWTGAWTTQGGYWINQPVLITGIGSGKWRLQRIGNIMNGYQWENNTWIKFASKTGCDLSDMYVLLSVYNNIPNRTSCGPQLNQECHPKNPNATFDNFIVRSGIIVSNNKLVAYYPFDGSANDTSGNGNNGTNYGAVLSTGKIGQGYNFSGDDYIEIPNNPMLNSNTGTWALWIKLNQISSGNGYEIIGKHDSADSANGIGIREWQGLIRASIKSSSPQGVDFEDSPSINDGNWHHIAVSFTSNSDSYFYVDGDLINTKISPDFIFSSQPLRIGKSVDTWWQGFNGSIDEVKIWNYALSEEDIKRELTRGMPKLIAYYPFEGNANDMGGNGNHGIVYGTGATFSLDSGRIGEGLKFNGINNYVNVSNSVDFSNLPGLTISVWIKPSTIPVKWEGIIDKGYNSSFIIGKRDTINEFGFGIGKNGDTNFITTTGALDNNWHHISATANGNILKIYIDGVLNYTAPQTVLIGNNNYSLVIGADMSTYPSQKWFNGSIDEVKIWNYALSDNEINREYRRIKACVNNSQCIYGEECIGGECILKANKSLVVHYEFEGNADDLSGKQNTGAVYLATFSDGKIGQGLEFNGKDSYVRISDNPILRLRAYSVSAWIKPKLNSSYEWAGIVTREGRNYNIWYHFNNSFIHHRYHDNGSWNSGANDTPNNSIIKGQWNPVIITNDGKISKTYINGTEKSSGIVNGSLFIDNYDVYIGKQFNGSIDEVKIWNYALTKRQVASESDITFNCTINLDCDDGDDCTRDLCNNVSGVCSYEFNNSIPGCGCNSDADCADSNICTNETCNTQTHTCAPKINNNGAACEDGDGCTVNDICSGGVCVTGTPRNCSDSSNCTTDTCSSGQCQHSNIGCPCTNTTQCQSNNPCVTDYCNITLSRCAATYLNIECNDTNSNTIFDWCDDSVCRGVARCNRNKICDANRGETCSNCAWDCGVCPGGTSGSTSGGTSGSGSSGSSGTGTGTSGSSAGTSASTTSGSSGAVGTGTGTSSSSTFAKIIFFTIIIGFVIGILVIILYFIKSINNNSRPRLSVGVKNNFR
ncbi:MAG: LamG domain-containing protein [Nanoarchaeota archaeon]